MYKTIKYLFNVDILLTINPKIKYTMQDGFYNNR